MTAVSLFLILLAVHASAWRVPTLAPVQKSAPTLTVSAATTISLATPRNLSATSEEVLQHLVRQSLSSVIGLSPNAIAVTNHSYTELDAGDAGGGHRKLWRTPTASPVPSSSPSSYSSTVPTIDTSSIFPSLVPTASPSSFNTSLPPTTEPTEQPTATSTGTQQPTTTQAHHYVLQQLSLSIEFDVAAPAASSNVSANATVAAARSSMNHLISSVTADGSLGAAVVTNVAISGNGELNNPVTLASAQHLLSFGPPIGAGGGVTNQTQPTRKPTASSGGGGGGGGGGAVNHVKTSGQGKAASASPALAAAIAVVLLALATHA